MEEKALEKKAFVETLGSMIGFVQLSAFSVPSMSMS